MKTLKVLQANVDSSSAMPPRARPDNLSAPARLCLSLQWAFLFGNAWTRHPLGQPNQSHFVTTTTEATYAVGGHTLMASCQLSHRLAALPRISARCTIG